MLNKVFIEKIKLMKLSEEIGYKNMISKQIIFRRKPSVIVRTTMK